MADEFDPLRIERLLVQLGESVVASAQNIEEITNPELFEGDSLVAALSPTELRDGRSAAVLDGDSVLDSDLGEILAGIPGISSPAESLADRLSFDQISEMLGPTIETAQADPALIEAQTFPQVGAGDSHPPGADLFDLTQDAARSDAISAGQEQNDAIISGQTSQEFFAGAAADFANFSGPGTSEGPTLDLAAGSPEFSPGDTGPLATDSGAADAAADGEVRAASDAVDFDLGSFPEFSWDTTPPAEVGVKSDEFQSPGYQHIYDNESSEEILEVASEFRDESREWRRNLLYVLRGIVDDLRADNSLLNDVRRHFEQSRKTY